MIYIFTSCFGVREIPHIVSLTITCKTNIHSVKTRMQILLPTSRATSPLKRMFTTLGILIWSPILVYNGRIWMIEPLLRLLVTRIIRPRTPNLLPYLPNFGLLNSLCKDHEPRDIHVIKKHCHKTQLLDQYRHSHQKFVHPSPRVGYHAWTILRELGEFERVLSNTHSL